MSIEALIRLLCISAHCFNYGESSVTLKFSLCVPEDPELRHKQHWQPSKRKADIQERSINNKCCLKNRKKTVLNLQIILTQQILCASVSKCITFTFIKVYVFRHYVDDGQRIEVQRVSTGQEQRENHKAANKWLSSLCS